MVTQKSELDPTLQKTIAERDQLKICVCESDEECGRLREIVDELKLKIEDLKHIEGKNAALDEQLSTLNSLLINRVIRSLSIVFCSDSLTEWCKELVFHSYIFWILY